MPSDRTVYIVDDDAAVRRSLQELLRSAGFIAVCFDTPFGFLDAAPRLSGGCVLLDVLMPGMDGLTLQLRLRERGIALPLVVMTGHGDVQTAVRAMKAGAMDFIEKPFDDETLLAAIEAALAGRGDDRRREVSDASRRLARLSPREREVLDALVAGSPNKVIAFDLGISIRTVEVHRAHMMERLGVRQFADAIRLALTARLAAPDVRAGGRDA
jgi:two-component system response regulator FixJ